MSTFLQQYQGYYRRIWQLGLPIFVGQLGSIVVGFADNMMVGRYSTLSLAASSFVNNVFNVAMLCCIGFTYGLLPLSGALYSKGKKVEIGGLMRNTLVLNVMYTLLLTAVMTVLYFNVHRLGQPVELLPLIRPYFLLFLAGLLPVSAFNVFAQWSYSIQNTTMPMWIVLSSNALNIAGNYALIYGNWGCPELGLTGAGISTLVARILCPLVIMLWFFLARSNREYRIGFTHATIQMPRLKRIFVTSLPVSMQMTFEASSFSVAAVMAGWIGATALAAFQIVIIIGMLGFCLYYAIGSAIAVLVSNEAGKKSPDGMRRAGWAGYHVMLLLASVSTCCFIFFARPLMHLFTQDHLVLSLGMTLLFPLILYQLGDATQITFANALRGTSHVLPMLWIAFVSYIVVGVPATYALAFIANLQTYGIVLSFSVSLFLAAALFLIFFLRATRQNR